MSKKSKTLIAVLGVLVLISGAYFGSTVRSKKKSDTSSDSFTPSPRLGNLESSDLVKMEFPSLTLEKEGGTWTLKSYEGAVPPEGIELDQSQIQALTWYLASLWIDSIVDEEPGDLSVYGLDPPSSRVALTDSEGTQAVYLLGDTTPSRSTCYVMEEGDPKVYSVSVYLTDNMDFPLERIRERFLFPAFQFQQVGRFSMESSGTFIEITGKPETLKPYLASTYSNHVIASHYKLMRGTFTDTLSKLLAPFNNLQIDDFIEDSPSSLKPYGLDGTDKPVRIILQPAGPASPITLDLLIGHQVEGGRYAKLTGKNTVFTLSGLESVISSKPFDLIDKFILLINIEMVDHIAITGGEKDLSVDIKRSADGEEFFLNGRKAQDRSFRSFYESVIAIMADAEYPHNPAPAQNGEKSIIIEHTLNTPPGERVSITLIPYNRDFYALLQEGTMEFLVSREQIQKIYTRADAMLYE